MSRLEFRNISKSFDSTVVLEGMSFTVEPKEFVVLLGPSGCGKTTLLRIVAGLEEPTAGDVLLDDQVINHIPTAKRNVAMVFQNYALYPHMTVAKNLGFGLRMRGIAKSEIRERMLDAAKLLGIDDLLSRKPAQLSGGQKQRVAMGRAIIRKPAIFLFDEPLSNLDAALRSHMRTEIKRLHKRLGITTVYVTHDQVEALTLASKIILLHNGKIQQAGTPREIYHAPSNMFVASFIGSPAMNFIRARGSDEVAALMRDVIAKPDMNLDELVLGIRPEDFSLSAPHGDESWRSIEIDVQVVEPLGSRVQLTGEFANQEIIAVLPENSSSLWEGKLCLWFEMNRVHVFDEKSGRRVG